ncbi:uncharacterized protein LOC143817898 [Ranitomeya variabilis]|uniref:uncharacterized protein LOC143817898 n=1 Tax=Ranitomeya variabilis TaxID=490064 RepID=UPI004056543C
MAEKRANTNISTPGLGCVIIDKDLDEDVIISSDKEQEDEITNGNDDAPRGPMAENRDVLENINISTPRPDYVIINMDLDEDVVIYSDKQEDGEHIPPPLSTTPLPLCPPPYTTLPLEHFDDDLGLAKDMEKCKVFMELILKERLAYYASQNLM